MGTRSLTCVVLDGEYRVAQYGQDNGDYMSAGVNILSFLHSVDLGILKRKVSNLKFLTEHQCNQLEAESKKCMFGLTKEEIGQIYPQYYAFACHPTKENMKSYFAQPFVNIDPKLGWNVLRYIMTCAVTALPNMVTFAGESLHCEWAYVIDFDTNKFEVFKGLNQEKLTAKERFSKMEADGEYEPVKFVTSFDLNNLPAEDRLCKEISERVNN